jgi:FkbM family methyltransferase
MNHIFERGGTRGRNILYSLGQIPRGCRVALYGSGIISSLFRAVLAAERKDVSVSCLINTFSGGIKDGMTVVRVDDLPARSNQYDLIIVTSTIWNEIEDELVKRKYDHFVLSNMLIHSLYNSLSVLGGFCFERSNRDDASFRLKAVLGFFDHEEDKEAYRILMNMRLGVDENESMDFFKRSYDKHRKIYLEHLDRKRGGVIIEGGVANGADSVSFFEYFEGCGPVSIYGFEPFVDEFNKSPHRTFLEKKGMRLFAEALWNRNEELFFNVDTTSPGASSILRGDLPSERRLRVRGVTIDSFVEEHRLGSVDLIKLDIEGAELEALIGARDTIRRFKPQLALSLYHKREHLYEIPEYCLNIHRDYRLKLGFYSPTFLDTVLYAIPK